MKLKNIVKRVSAILRLNNDDMVKQEFETNYKKPIESSSPDILEKEVDIDKKTESSISLEPNLIPVTCDDTQYHADTKNAKDLERTSYSMKSIPIEIQNNAPAFGRTNFIEMETPLMSPPVPSSPAKKSTTSQQRGVSSPNESASKPSRAVPSLPISPGSPSTLTDSVEYQRLVKCSEKMLEKLLMEAQHLQNPVNGLKTSSDSNNRNFNGGKTGVETKHDKILRLMQYTGALPVRPITPRDDDEMPPDSAQYQNEYHKQLSRSDNKSSSSSTGNTVNSTMRSTQTRRASPPKNHWTPSTASNVPSHSYGKGSNASYISPHDTAAAVQAAAEKKKSISAKYSKFMNSKHFRSMSATRSEQVPSNAASSPQRPLAASNISPNGSADKGGIEVVPNMPTEKIDASRTLSNSGGSPGSRRSPDNPALKTRSSEYRRLMRLPEALLLAELDATVSSKSQYNQSTGFYKDKHEICMCIVSQLFPSRSAMSGSVTVSESNSPMKGEAFASPMGKGTAMLLYELEQELSMDAQRSNARELDTDGANTAETTERNVTNSPLSRSRSDARPPPPVEASTSRNGKDVRPNVNLQRLSSSPSRLTTSVAAPVLANAPLHQHRSHVVDKHGDARGNVSVLSNMMREVKLSPASVAFNPQAMAKQLSESPTYRIASLMQKKRNAMTNAASINSPPASATTAPTADPSSHRKQLHSRREVPATPVTATGPGDNAVSDQSRSAEVLDINNKVSTTVVNPPVNNSEISEHKAIYSASVAADRNFKPVIHSSPFKRQPLQLARTPLQSNSNASKCVKSPRLSAEVLKKHTVEMAFTTTTNSSDNSHMMPISVPIPEVAPTVSALSSPSPSPVPVIKTTPKMLKLSIRSSNSAVNNKLPKSSDKLHAKNGNTTDISAFQDTRNDLARLKYNLRVDSTVKIPVKAYHSAHI